MQAPRDMTSLLWPSLQTSMVSSTVKVGVASRSGPRQMDQRPVVGSTAVDSKQRQKRRRRHIRKIKYLCSGDDSRHQLQTGSHRQKERQPKNALMQLNELIPRDPGAKNSVKFRAVTRSGPDHSPMYKASLEFNGQVDISH
jgi:hypothetical protein